MKLRLGAAVILAALTPLTAVTAPSPAGAGVDITPPEVGSCHGLTLEEGYKFSDRDPAVDCAERHTTLTVAVVDFGEAPDWDDADAVWAVVQRQCLPAMTEVLGGDTKTVRRSAFSLFWFGPTAAQRDAGAAWARCDVALWGGDRLMALPADLTLGGLPLPDGVARCRVGEGGNFAPTVCSRSHRYRATVSIRYPHSSYPGDRASARFARNKCADRMNGAAHYWESVPSRVQWQLGFRHAVCLKQTTR